MYSLRTNLCLQYKPQFIASAAIYLASKFLKYTLAPDGKKAWWEVLDAKIDELEGEYLDLLIIFAIRFFFHSPDVILICFCKLSIYFIIHLFSSILMYLPPFDLLFVFTRLFSDISNQILDLYESTPNLSALKGGELPEGSYGSGSFFIPSTPPPNNQHRHPSSHPPHPPHSLSQYP